MPLILPGNVASATAAVGYDVANSCRWDRASSPEMVKTLIDGDRQKFTLSWWMKGFPRGVDWNFVKNWAGSGDNSVNIRLLDAESEGSKFSFLAYTGGATDYAIVPTRLFRDPSAWIHIVFAVDTTQGTAANRINLYINGTKETAFSTETYPDQNDNLKLNEADQTFYFGVAQNSTNFFDGYFAEIVFLDGTQAANTDLGEFDSDSPTIWKPVDPSGLTFGTNGFYLDFEASGNLGNDVNGGTDLSETNLAAADQATDTPTNNFCVLNPLDNRQQGSTFSEGMCKLQTTNAAYGYNTGTIGVSTGKWYYECEVLAESAAQMSQIGFSDNTGEEQYLLNNCYPYIGSSVNGYSYKASGYYQNNNSQSTTGFSAYTTSIISVYLDLDNSKIYWAKDDTMENSGTGKWGAALPAGTFMLPACGDFNAGSYNVLLGANFGGCPPVAPDSAVADKNGYGAFEFDPSRGGASDFDGAAKDFLAICTKNLAEEG